MAKKEVDKKSIEDMSYSNDGQLKHIEDISGNNIIIKLVKQKINS